MIYLKASRSKNRLIVLISTIFILVKVGMGAVFPTAIVSATDNARIEINDTIGGLSFNPPSGTPAPNALTVMAWVKLSIPTGTDLSGNMTVLGNRKTLDWNSPHAYRFYFDISTGNLEFSARGTSSLTPIKLVERPYLDRWYHLAVVRSNNNYTPYVDGRALTPVSQDIGNSATTDGVSIGGFKGGEKLWGEIQEVAIFHSVLSAVGINTYRLRDIPTATTPSLRGYFKLSYASTVADNLKNFAASPATGTENGFKIGTGTIDFPETDKQGEQSLFDSQKNYGRDALAPLAGAFSWQRTLLSRPTASIPFEFRVGYNSGISFNSQALEGGNNMFEEDAVLGPGWRHSFQTRLVPGSKFLVGGSGFIGLLLWDGSLETLQNTGNSIYKPVHREYRGEFILDPSDSDYMLWITTERLIYRFYHPTTTSEAFLAGKLAEIRDFNGNKVILEYDQSAGLLDKVTDTSGNVWQFTYNAGLLKTVTSLGWKATFNYDGQNKLSDFFHDGPSAYKATPPLNTIWTFNYTQPNGAASASVLNTVTTPIGTKDVVIGYDKYGRKTTETDGGGRFSSYQYLTPGSRQVTRTDGDGKKWIDTFDRKGHVVSKADPLGNTTRFEYYALTNGVTEANLVGGTPASAGAMKRQIEPLGWVTTFDTYDDRANLLQKTDALGQVWKWTFAKSTDPAGANGKLTDGNPGGALNALLNRPLTDTRPTTFGETTDWQNRYIYDSRGNLLRHEDDLGKLAEYSYDARGLALTSRDGNYSPTHLSESSSAYDPVSGFRVSSTDPYGKTTTYQTTELGWVKSATNPRDETVTNEFDINGQIIRRTNPLGHTTSATYDAIGRQTSTTDARGQKSESQYDRSNLLTWTKDRAGNIATFSHNGRSLLTQTSSPAVPISQPTGAPVLQSINTQRTYDDVGRPLREIDPTGTDYVEHSYDGNGNEIATRDKLGRLYRKQYDAMNRVAVEIDPLGNTRTTTYDEAGRLLTVTSPNGTTTRHEYDGRGRLKKWTDPEGSVWIYTYDFVGNITDIEDALQGHYLMTYDLRNARLTEENQDHLHWTYTYDELGRLSTQTEPTGITRTMSYDPAGRLERVAFSTGRENSLDYDFNNNIEEAYRRDANGTITRTNFFYDALNRPYRSTDAFGKSVDYGYDALGRVISLTYPGGKVLTQEFDIRSRLVRQSTAATWGAHTLNYGWDKEGCLTGQTYPNGIFRAATYDESGRQLTLSYTDGKGTADAADDVVQIALSYGYDRNGNPTSGKEKGLLTYPPPAVHDESALYTPGGRLQTCTDAADPTGAKNWTYEFKNADNSPSFNLSKALNPVIGSLALTYDEDNRTTRLNVTPPAGSPNPQPSTTTNRYDATGRRIARSLTTQTGASPVTTETRYVLNLIGGMERILADTTATGAITAYYVHGPDLAVKIDATDPAKITCYHADASGNIVRLTDKDRAPIAQYAYSDYGRPFATNAAAGQPDTNPYRFVGSQGVMEEPLIPGLYFMRARYYLADAGVFLSVDPVKNIGAGWRPEAYGYGLNNPLRFADPTGLYWEVFEGTSLKTYFAFGNKGATEEAAITREGTFYTDRRETIGLGTGIGASVNLGGYYAGDRSDWDDFDKAEVALGLFSVSVSRNPKGKFGISLDGSAGGLEFGITGSRIIKANQTPVMGGTGNPVTGASNTNTPSSAGKYAQTNNGSTSTTSAPSTRSTGSTSSGSGGNTYTVSAGQTFNGIAKTLGISPATLRDLNPGITNYDKINVNQKLNTRSSTSSGGSSGTASKPGTSTGSASGSSSSSKGKK